MTCSDCFEIGSINTFTTKCIFCSSTLKQRQLFIIERLYQIVLDKHTSIKSKQYSADLILQLESENWPIVNYKELLWKYS